MFFRKAVDRKKKRSFAFAEKMLDSRSIPDDTAIADATVVHQHADAAPALLDRTNRGSAFFVDGDIQGQKHDAFVGHDARCREP
jgi:hypothetical protein